MNANALLKWLVPALLLGVALILGRSWTGSPGSSPTADEAQPGLSAAEAQALGIAGDTPNDTVATLVGQVKAMRSELLGMKQANGELQEENNRLRHRENGIDTRIDSALNGLKATASAERQQADEARRKAEEENRQARGLLQQLHNTRCGPAPVPREDGTHDSSSQQARRRLLPDHTRYITTSPQAG
jgi:integrating conjugative element protein (TIGR03752 family)